MSAKTPNLPPIDPYLNPAYWNNRYIGGDGTAVPPARPLKLIDHGHILNTLKAYQGQGSSKLALERVAEGDEFDADNFPHGTVLLSMCENLSADKKTPMSTFTRTQLPERTPKIGDPHQHLSGHGYLYSAHTLLNVIVGFGKKNRVGVLTDADSGELLKTEDIMQRTNSGIPKYTIGEVYSPPSNKDSALIRVSELIVVMHGIKPRGKRIFNVNWLPGTRT